MKGVLTLLTFIGFLSGQIRAGTLLSGISTLDVMNGVKAVRFRKTPEIITALVKGEVDLAVIPAEMAAKLYLDGHEITIVAADMFQNQAILSLEIKTPHDLRGKTVAALLSSGTYMTFKSYMKEVYRLSAGRDFTVINAPPGALPDILMKGDADAIVAWEPLVSIVLSKGGHIVTDFTHLWKKLGYQGDPVMLLWVTSPRFKDSRSIDEFLKLRKRAARFWIENADSTVKTLVRLYNFDEDLARRIYSRVKIYPGSLDKRMEENIKLVWKIAWKGGYLKRDPTVIPMSIFYRPQAGSY